MRFNDEDIRNIMEQNRLQLNELLPAYEKITEIEIRQEEFEKTPKRSIKRFLYK
jgi:long-chain acyl-CoA synthetase